MNKYPQLEIETKGLRKAKFYIGFMAIFWVIWVPITLFAVMAAIDKFSFFWVLWLPFGVAGVVLIPISLYGLNGSHLLIAESGGIRILSDRALLQREVFIEREELESVMIGHYDSDSDGESVVTLNIFRKSGWFNKRVMIAPFVHPCEKRKIYTQILSFLEKNNFQFKKINTQKTREAEQGHSL
ncbi:hypothetical protein D1BOALGB6SA_941 [Olavius sp. associated proteobacterium Delta 1]|nr:hypothetical protein D1BOALGB6SA_941 [Olavius sp. associated proteobacterium Delta 1]